MTATIVRADACHLPLASGSVDLIVTSPPYWALRSYTDGGEHYAGQIGAEPTPTAYIDSLIECTREWMRVLKPGGSMWINLGDKYNAYNGNRGQGTIQRNEIRQSAAAGAGLDVADIRPKSLLMLPERYRIACVDRLGLIARAVVIWSKPNGLPESVTDRVRRSHEDWVHLVKQPRYFAAVDTIREPHVYPHDDRSKRPNGYAREMTGHMNGGPHPLGKLPGSVWEIATQPLKVPAELGVDHFAAFPMEWPRRIIQGWSPSGICTACGEGRRPISSRELTVNRGGRQTQRGFSAVDGGAAGQTLGFERVVVITGEACACPDTTAPTRPAVVLDPFGGTGTTALVADALGRRGISVDMSADYCRLAAWRTADPGQRAAAMQVPKPPEVSIGTQTLFEAFEVEESAQ